jgi:four helix bundle protein
MQNCNLKFKTDLKARCYSLSLNILKITDKLPNKRSSWVISDQLIRSITSIGANLIEAKASSSRLEFKKFNEIALKSANESKYWLGLLRDGKIADEEEVNTLLSEVNEISNMIAAGVIKLKNKKS